MLTIQFGQCGNQLGYSLFQQISADLDAKDTGISKQDNHCYNQQSFEKWFTDIDTKNNRRRLSRAVLVDTEHKVINKVFNNLHEKWRYKPQNCVCQADGGSANNWAYGNLIKGRQLKNDIVELVRQEVERVDHFEGILFLLSSGGGTGSGVGSCSAQFLRDEFTNKSFVSSIVLPFSSGEVGVQNYNSMLTLSTFYETMDLIFLFQNENIHDLCSKVLKNHETKLQDINVMISKKLSAVLQPFNDTWSTTNFLVSTVAPHPSYKITSIESTPHIASSVSQFEPFYSWKFYVQQLRQKLRVRTFESNLVANAENGNKFFDSYYKATSNTLISRGNVTDGDPMVCDELKKKEFYANWVEPSDRLNHLNRSRKIFNQEKFLTLITNNSQACEITDNIVAKAWNAYTNSAFLHHYRRYGLEDDDFLRAFSKCEQIIKDYKALQTS